MVPALTVNVFVANLVVSKPSIITLAAPVMVKVSRSAVEMPSLAAANATILLAAMSTRALAAMVIVSMPEAVNMLISKEPVVVVPLATTFNVCFVVPAVRLNSVSSMPFC